MRSILGALAVLVILTSSAAHGADLSSLSNQEAGTGVRDALVQGAGKAVDLLGRPGGFLDNSKVRIPLPDSLRRVESGMRLLGMREQADELVVSMNRAAEAAVPASIAPDPGSKSPPPLAAPGARTRPTTASCLSLMEAATVPQTFSAGTALCGSTRWRSPLGSPR